MLRNNKKTTEYRACKWNDGWCSNTKEFGVFTSKEEVEFHGRYDVAIPFLTPSFCKKLGEELNRIDHASGNWTVYEDGQVTLRITGWGAAISLYLLSDNQLGAGGALMWCSRNGGYPHAYEIWDKIKEYASSL